MEADKIKLTPKQNAVVWCLQNGYTLVTSCSMAGAIVGCRGHEFRISSRVFWALYNMGLIYQGGEREAFSYLLTPKGRVFPTKPINPHEL